MDSTSMKDKKIFELTDVLEETGSPNNQDVIVIDGRGYEKETKPEEIPDLVMEENTRFEETGLNEEIKVTAKETAEKTVLEIMPEIIERITREIVPKIAEKIIREEIEKLKKLSANK